MDPDDLTVNFVLAQPPQGDVPAELLDLARDILGEVHPSKVIPEALLMLLARVLLGFAVECIENRLRERLRRAKYNPLYRLRLQNLLARGLSPELGPPRKVASALISGSYAALGTPAWRACYPPQER